MRPRAVVVRAVVAFHGRAGIDHLDCWTIDPASITVLRMFPRAVVIHRENDVRAVGAATAVADGH